MIPLFCTSGGFLVQVAKAREEDVKVIPVKVTTEPGNTLCSSSAEGGRSLA
jgi:hypothetical protein